MPVVPSRSEMGRHPRRGTGRTLEPRPCRASCPQRWFAGKARTDQGVRNSRLDAPVPSCPRLGLPDASSSRPIRRALVRYLSPPPRPGDRRRGRPDREGDTRAGSSPGGEGGPDLRRPGRIPSFGWPCSTRSGPGRGRSGRIGVDPGASTSAFAEAREARQGQAEVAGGSFEQSNSAILFGDRLILKILPTPRPGHQSRLRDRPLPLREDEIRPDPRYGRGPALRTRGLRADDARHLARARSRTRGAAGTTPSAN